MMGARVTNKNNGIPQPELPDDCLKLIFHKLNTKKDRDSFGLTCHNFLDIQNSCRKHLNFKYSPIRRVVNPFDHSTSLTSCDKLLQLFQRFGYLESLSLTNDDRLLYLESSINKLKLYLCRLHSLDLSGCSYVTDKGVTSVASNCPLLSVIRLRDCKLITDKGLNFVTKICKLLKQVDLSGCSNITDTGIGYLNKNCRQLRALRISGCLNILGIGFLGFSKSLASLEAEDCKLDYTGVAAILSVGGLEYLNLSNVKHTLRAIDLGGFGANIRFLDIVVGDDSIVNIAKGCPLLQEWNLSNCEGIKISSWESIGLYCQNLKTVQVDRYSFCFYHSELLTERLKALSRCRRLSVIYIYKRWIGEGLPPEILNVMRQDVKIIPVYQKDVLKKKTISWDNSDFTV